MNETRIAPSTAIIDAEALAAALFNTDPDRRPDDPKWDDLAGMEGYFYTRQVYLSRAAEITSALGYLDANAVRKQTLEDAARAWPVITRDMVSRGHVRDWLEQRARSIG